MYVEPPPPPAPPPTLLAPAPSPPPPPWFRDRSFDADWRFHRGDCPAPPAPPPPQLECQQQENGTVYGTGYIHLSNEASATACCDLCASWGDCRSWDWNVAPPHQCWLKDNTNTTKQDPQRIGGTSTPPPAPSTPPACAEPGYDDSGWRRLDVPHDFSREDLPSRAEDRLRPVIGARRAIARTSAALPPASSLPAAAGTARGG